VHIESIPASLPYLSQPETAALSSAPSVLLMVKRRIMQRPIGVTVIAILMFLGAAFLLGSAVCFFVGA